MEICIATDSITWHSQKTHKKEKKEKGKQNDGGRGGGWQQIKNINNDYKH